MTIRMIRIINWMPMLGWRCRCGGSNGRIFGNGTAIFRDWIGRNDYWNTIVVHATSKCIACSRILRVRQFYNYGKRALRSMLRECIIQIWIRILECTEVLNHCNTAIWYLILHGFQLGGHMHECYCKSNRDVRHKFVHWSKSDFTIWSDLAIFSVKSNRLQKLSRIRQEEPYLK